MRKILFLAAALLSSSLSFAQTETTWNDTDVNAAKGCQAYVNELHSGATSNITDDDLNTSCQVRTAESETPTEWIVIDLGYEYDITKLSLTTSGDRYDTGFAVYAASAQTTEPEFANGTDALDGSWGEAILTVSNTGQTEQGQYTRTYSVSASNVRYLKYAGVTRNATDIYGLTMNEFRVVGTTNDESATKVASIVLTLPTLMKGNTGDATVASYNDKGTKLAELTAGDVTLTSSDESVATVSGLTITGVAVGTTTITATYGDFTASASLEVAKNWDADDVLAGGTYTAYASSTREGDASSVVGAAGTFSTNDPATDTDQWWFVDLGEAYTVENIGLKQTNTYAAEFEVYTASALTDESAAVSNDNVTWSESAVATGSCSSDYYTATVSLNSASNVRFIKIHATTGGGLYNTYGMAIQRFYLEGKPTNAALTVGEADEKGKVTCSGYFVEETFNAIDATVIDLTGVSGVPSTLSNTTKNPNAIVYATNASGVNVCTGAGAQIANLELTDGYDYKPEQWFNVGDAKFNISLSADHYSFVYFPFDVTTVPDGVTLYSIKSASTESVVIEEATTLTRETAYIIKADAAGNYVFEGGNNPCGAGNNLATAAGGVTITSTLTKTTAPDGAYMFNSSNELAKVSGTGVTLYPFAGYISAGLPEEASAKLTITTDDNVTAIESATISTTSADDAIYNISGQRVNKSYKGLVVKNGKKYINK